jgi:hypothetical protein
MANPEVSSVAFDTEGEYFSVLIMLCHCIIDGLTTTGSKLAVTFLVSVYQAMGV